MENDNKTPAIRFKGFTETWEQRKLNEIVKSIDTGKSKFHADSNNGEYAILGSTSIIGYDDCYDYDGDFILTARVGANAGSLYRYTGKAKISDNTVFIQADKNIEFVYYMLTKFDIKQLSFGTGQPLVKASELKNLDLKMPTQIEEQKRIGSFSSQLDNLITLHQRKYDKLIQFKAAMLQKMFPQNGADKPEIRFKGFTDAWEQRKLEEVITVGNGMDYKHLSEGDIPVYGTGGYMLSVDKALSYDKDAIGIGRKGTIDKPYVLKAPFWTVDTLFYCIPKEDYSLDFVYCIFQNVNWKEKDESTGVPSLSKVNINFTDVKVPTLAEQEKIEEYFSKLDSIITLHQRKCEKYKSIKAGLIRKLFP